MKKILIPFLTIFMVVLCSCTLSSSNKEMENDPQNAAYIEPTEQLDDIESIDTSITDLLMSKGYTLDHATAIHEILNTIGIESIEIESMTGSAEDGLNAVVCYPNGYTERDRRFTFTTDNGILFYAGFLNEDLYDSEQGGFLKSYEDVHVPEKDVSLDIFNELQYLSTEEVKSCLNFPKTADFSTLDWKVGRSDNNYMILGKVTAENGFGTEEEILFTVWFINENGTFITEGISLNGTRVK